ncbi:hypothetical protein CP532_4267, partial [Ophiocordyceps camponoti-leonardi (nom. inval.)]
ASYLPSRHRRLCRVVSCMAPHSADKVRIHLSASRACEDYIDRHLVLTMDCPDVQIGRMSHRNPGLHASSTNAWFDSPVMSRQHAMLHFDARETKLYIQDTGSLHGTFQNGIRLAPSALSQLKPYDELCFGTTVDRNADTYPPCTTVVTFEFVCTDRGQANAVVYRISDDSDVEETGCCSRNQTKSVVYRVPDDTDVEEISDDDDEEEEEEEEDEEDEDCSIRGSIIALARNNKVKPVQKTQKEPLSAMDVAEPRAAEKALDADHIEDLIVSGMPRKDHASGKERRGSDWQPSSPTVYSVSDEQRDAGHHIKLSPAERAEDDSTGSEWEDCSSPGRSLVASPPLPSALPASWETEGSSSSADSSRSVFCPYRGTNRPDRRDSMSPGLQGAAVLPSISTSPPPNDAEMGESRDNISERELSNVKGSANFCDPVNTMVCGDRRDMTDTLSSSNASRVPIPHSLRLPPMATTPPIPPPPPPPPLSHGRSAESAAEALGEKSGKKAFFAARLENKRLLESASKGLSVAGPAGHDEVESVADKDEGVAVGDGSGPYSLFGLSVESAHPLEDAPKTSLLASGERFLSSPLLEREAPVRPPQDCADLNETSAYQFLLSKATIRMRETAEDEAVKEQEKATKQDAATSQQDSTTTKDDAAVEKHVEVVTEHGSAVDKKAHDQGASPSIQELLECAEEIAKTVNERSRKRKAGEMSADSGDGEAAPAPGTASASGTRPVGETDKNEYRTVKRLRLAAEVLGYAALGGVAVVSALIATAPSL